MKKEYLIYSLKQKGFSKKILDAFEEVERKDFVPKEFWENAYEDEPLPIGKGQTISQPHTIAFMLDLLELKDRQKILEVGSGSGYVLALMENISKNSEIYGIERIKDLADRSRETLKGIENITVVNADGSKGLKSKAPFDRILVSASASKTPQELVKQLKVNGIIVASVRDSVIKIKKLKTKNKEEKYHGFRFVPLIGG